MRAQQLLDRARTIAVVGPVTDRTETTLAYLRRVGYDVIVVPGGPLTDIPGPIDLALVLGTSAHLPRLLQEASEMASGSPTRRKRRRVTPRRRS
jgi:predicted CoA-binding protein